MAGQPPEGAAFYCEDGDYWICNEFEVAMLYWPGGEFYLGWHHGEPSCAAMDAAQGWCATGGTGLRIHRFPDGYPTGGQTNDDVRCEITDLWSDGSVSGLWRVVDPDPSAPARLRVAAKPADAPVGLFEIDLTTLAFHRV